MNSEAYNEGQQAYRDGKLPEDNPYQQLNSDKACDWYKGFVDAYAEWAEGKEDEQRTDNARQTH